MATTSVRKTLRQRITAFFNRRFRTRTTALSTTPMWAQTAARQPTTARRFQNFFIRRESR
ncbi:hypothetical protein PRIPAC_97493 [Pristionchus pacificus]|uniref:Uncharacterized protein n=1 Tax=Pristionchus pacificus TaxID=54126 RepID=A0A2A6BY62_PRIPA|nr:hypothetical protein PRIPAC_97493 [Pristionchus pacificus]|eukprot:PDM70701.1 hypothetical protein PRIPAC_43906 [Pristionchus pacificus]